MKKEIKHNYILWFCIGLVSGIFPMALIKANVTPVKHIVVHKYISVPDWKNHPDPERIKYCEHILKTKK